MIPVWLSLAQTYTGLREIPGAQSESRILQMAARLGGWIKSFYTNDDIPWCALFVNDVLQQVGIPGTNSLAARSFATWGVPLSAPSLGCVCVFSREGGGHVGFYLGEDVTGGRLRIFGGNQDNHVGEAWIARARLVAMRWPRGELLPVPAPIVLQPNGQPVSTNEG